MAIKISCGSGVVDVALGLGVGVGVGVVVVLVGGGCWVVGMCVVDGVGVRVAGVF